MIIRKCLWHPAKRWEFPGKILIQVPPFLNYLKKYRTQTQSLFCGKKKLFAESVNFPILFSEGHVSFTTATLDIRIQHEFGWCLSKGLYTRLVVSTNTDRAAPSLCVQMDFTRSFENHHQMQKYKSCLNSFLSNFDSFEVP